MSDLPRNDGISYEALGGDHMLAGRFEEAAAAYRNALIVDPTSGLAAIALIDIYRALQRPIEARNACLRAIEIVPKDASLKLNLAWLHFETRDYEAAIEQAQSLLQMDVDLELPACRSLVFSMAAAGRWSGAAAIFDRIQARFPDALAEIASETASTFEGVVRSAAEAGDHRAARTLLEALPRQVAGSGALNLMALQSVVAASSFRARAFTDGLSVYREAIRSPGREPGLKKRAGGITAVTSIMPFRLAVQKRAIASWRALGFHIVSVNESAEAALLKADFPFVEFVAVERTAKERLGRPLVYFDDLLSAAEQAPGQAVGVINSDIVLLPQDDAFVEHIEAWTKTSIAFGNRIDTDGEICNPDGPVYRDGYDWFFIDKGQVPTFRDSGLVFGAPWWDLWIPTCSLLAGIELINVQSPAAYHSRHVTAWDQRSFATMGETFVEAMTRQAELALPRSEAAGALVELTRALQQRGSAGEVRDEIMAGLSLVTNAIVQSSMRLA